jgi:hypothetical protein
MASDTESKAGPAGARPAWTDPALIAGRVFCEWLSRPRVRLAVTGVALLVIGGLQLMSSVWTLPLVLVGATMVVTAWIGHRLEGRFAVEWGKTGTELAFRARIGASEEDEVRSRPPLSVDAVEPADAEVIEGEAHTVEIDVAELKALLAAVEQAGGAVRPPEPAGEAIRILRVPAGGQPGAATDQPAA